MGGVLVQIESMSNFYNSKSRIPSFMQGALQPGTRPFYMYWGVALVDPFIVLFLAFYHWPQVPICIHTDVENTYISY